MLRKAHWHILWHDDTVVAVGTRFAALDRHAPASISAGNNTGTNIQTPELSSKRGSVRGIRGGKGANCKDFIGNRPVE